MTVKLTHCSSPSCLRAFEYESFCKASSIGENAASFHALTVAKRSSAALISSTSRGRYHRTAPPVARTSAVKTRRPFQARSSNAAPGCAAVLANERSVSFGDFSSAAQIRAGQPVPIGGNHTSAHIGLYVYFGSRAFPARWSTSSTADRTRCRQLCP